MTNDTRIVAHRVQCAAITNGCHSSIVWHSTSAENIIDITGQDLLTANGWHRDHGLWVCNRHPVDSRTVPPTEPPRKHCICPISPDGPEHGDPWSLCPVHGWKDR